MTTENKIKCVLMDFEINEITLREATKRMLLLLNTVEQNEQLVCPNCDGLGYTGKGTNEILPCLGSGERVD